MGWFDDDDNDSDDEKEQQHQAQLKNDNTEEEEEDPLDAYMKSLHQEDATSDHQASSSSSNRTGGRLDMDNEDEATSHWTTDESTVLATHEHKDEKEESFESSSSARLALQSTFHRAGGGNQNDDKKQHDNNLTLEPINHHAMQYIEFPKCLYTTTNTPQGHSWRQEHDVTCHPGTIDPILSFSQVQSTFGNDLIGRIHKQGYTTPTLVQSQTLPVALSGHDALVTASTGSGKTLAYTWPMILHLQHQTPLLPEETGPMAIVLVPTRELAIQVHSQVKTMLPSQFSSRAIIGGISNYHLLKDLAKQKCHVVVATPGRFLDLLRQRKMGLSLEKVTYCVLDEADKMLTMGFEQQVSSIVQNTRPDRQTLMLSATMGKKVERVAETWLSDSFVRIAIGRTGESSQHVQQHVMVLPSYQDKKTWLREMVPVLANVGRTLVFVAKRSDCEEIAQMLRQQQDSPLRIETLHGEKHQSDRNAALRAFSKGKLDALIATDVAARGLDVKNVSTVINFDPAKNLDSHVHRIGRAGRLSQDQQHNKGVAYTLLTSKNADFAHVLMSAFEREGRQVTDALRSLAEKSRKSGNVASRTKWNKSGLGFNDHGDSPSSGGGNGYYGPSSSQAAAEAPPAKRSRWG